MDLAAWSRENRPDYPTMEAIGRFLLAKLSEHLRMDLAVFREHYVEEGSIVLTFRAITPLADPALPTMEGVLLFDVAPAGKPPYIDAELLLFSASRRLSQTGDGGGFLQSRYDLALGWGALLWHHDTPEDWEAVTAPRTSDYAAVIRTYDPPKPPGQPF